MPPAIVNRLDRIAVSLSGLCAVHCVATVILVATLPALGHIFQANWIHETGLAIAIIIAAVALLSGIRRHGSLLPLWFGAIGLALMTSALMIEHGELEAVLTVSGVTLVAIGHLYNQRSCRIAGRSTFGTDQR